MRKANFTLTQHTIASRLLLMCALVCSSLVLQAQTESYFCGDLFHDDGGAGLPYDDSKSLTQVVCPDDPDAQFVRLVFNRYDIAGGDLFEIYNNDDASGTPVWTNNSLAGASVSSVSGGWIDADFCVSPCLTIKFTPNGDQVKGAGWNTVVECFPFDGFVFDDEDKTFTYVARECDQDVSVNLPIPSYTNPCDPNGMLMTVNDCANGSSLTVSGGMLTGTVGLGQTIVTFTDPTTGQDAAYTINVLPKTLSCNDDLNVSLLNECTVVLTPDLILEDPCFGPNVQHDVFFTNPHVNIIGTTANGFPIADFSGVECGTILDVKVERIIFSDCGDDFVDACWGQIVIEDKVEPELIAKVPSPVIMDVDCIFDTDELLDALNDVDEDGETIVLRPKRVDPNAPLETGVYTKTIVIPSLEDAFEIVDNCDADFVFGDWVEVDKDCTEGGQFDLYGSYFDSHAGKFKLTADDPIWASTEIDVIKPASIFKMYFRVVAAEDKCGNVSGAQLQMINVVQPDVKAPLIEYEVPCGTDINPIAIYEKWASDPEWFPEFAAYIPNIDPTPLNINTAIPQFDIWDNETPSHDLVDQLSNGSGDEIPLYPDHADCGYAIDWTDGNRIETCKDSYKLFREWTVYNWCDGHLEILDVIPQVIKVGDTKAPEIKDDAVSFELTGSPYYDCSADAIIKFEVEDDCSGHVQAYIELPGISPVELVVVDGHYRVNNVPVGQTFNFSLRLVDDCGNGETYFFHDFFIEDVIPPVAICEQFRAVSMGLDCEVEVPASSFDDGSYDNCGQVTFTVARMDELENAGFLFGSTDRDNNIFFDGDEDIFKPSVRFTKDDMNGCIGSETVVFRVEDGRGNYNYCMVEVELQDKIPPVARDRNITIDCDDILAGELTRAALAGSSAVQNFLNSGTFVDANGAAYLSTEDNCDNNTFLIDFIDVNGFDGTCKTGDLVIFYQTVDACGNVSLPGTATIRIDNKSDWEMKFPYDAVIFCEDGISIPAESTIDDILTNRGCDHWGLEVTEDTFEGEADACFKIIREYHLINWCTWEPSNTERAVVERPDQLITSDLPNDYRVALRYTDHFQNDGYYDGLLVDASNRAISGADGINDIDDGNEDFDFNGDKNDSPADFSDPRYLYRSGFGFQRGGGVSNPSAESIPMTGVSSGRSRSLDFMLGSNGDADEAAAYDPYDATQSTADGDWVLIDGYDTPYDPNFPNFWFIEFSQFSQTEQTYVSAQHYGNIVYRQIIKVNDVVAPIIVGQEVTEPFCGGEDDLGTGVACRAPVYVQFTVSDLCSENVDISVELRPFGGNNIISDPFGTIEFLGNGQYAISGDYPIIDGGGLTTHFFVITATDRCGNFVKEEIEFQVIDCKSPTPKCVFGLTVDLMPNGTIELPIEWFDKGSFDFCDDDVDLFFANPAMFPDSTTRIFNCNNGEIDVVMVELWARDNAGNTAFCETFVNIQANPQSSGSDACFVSGASVGGAIETEMAESVENVEVSLSGNTDGMRVTNAEGTYQFVGLEEGYDYSVTPASDDQPLNGVSTFDLVLISKHILGTELLDSPYKLIAADVNNSGSITTFDMVTLRKVILNVETNFPNNTSWRFVPADYEFANPANPFAENFPEVMNFNDLEENYMASNFIAVKVGDVNASAIANSELAEGRSFAGTFALTANDARLTVGEEYTVSFTAEEVAGYQFTMNFDGVELVKVEEGLATAENFGIFENELTASWNGVASDEVAFSVVVKATEDTRLSEAIAITSSKTAAEAYDVNGTVKAVAVNFVDAGYELAQNRPNPFSGETLIQITLPEAQRASLTVSDVTGKVLKVITQNFEAGYNEVKLNSKELASGVLYYTLRTDNFTATRKMVIIK